VEQSTSLAVPAASTTTGIPNPLKTHHGQQEIMGSKKDISGKESVKKKEQILAY